MARLIVRRNRLYQGADYLYHIIDDTWEQENIIAKYKTGIAGDTVDDIFNACSFVQETMGADLTIKAHCFEIDFEEITDTNFVDAITRNVLSYLGSEYQVIAVIVVNDIGSYRTQFVINSVSPITRRCFHDNNSTYCNIIRLLQKLIGGDVKFEIADGTFFDNGRGLAESYLY